MFWLFFIKFRNQHQTFIQRTTSSMKAFCLLLSGLFFTFSAFGQDISGQWNGILKVGNTPLPLVFNIKQQSEGYTATMDSPSQGAKGIPVIATSYKDSILTFKMTNLNISYEGKWNGTRFTGTFIQNGMQIPLILGREGVTAQTIPKPQEPIKPYPYHSEDVKFRNESANLTLAGTLTLPKSDGIFPVVVLISGSGSQNRDEEIMGHKPFLVLADHLTKNGIGVLRFDDRGTAESTGDFGNATTADFATDVKAAVAYLHTRKDINLNKIGLIGHSEGGIIAPMVAVDSKEIAFIVLLAGPGISGKEIMISQSRTMAAASGLSEEKLAISDKLLKQMLDVVILESDLQKMKTKLTPIVEESLQLAPNISQLTDVQKQQTIDQIIELQVSPWRKFFYSYDPAPALAQVKCPVLALIGSKDVQVPPTENLSAIRKALEKGKNKHFEVKELPRLNHLFQEAKTGLPDEYGTIEQTFSPIALMEITNWISKQIQ